MSLFKVTCITNSLTALSIHLSTDQGHMIAPLLQGVMVLQERHGKIITGRFCLSKFPRICWDMLALTSRIYRNYYKLPLGFLQNTGSDYKNSSPKICENCRSLRRLHHKYRPSTKHIWPASSLKPETNQNPNCLDGDQQRQPTKYHQKIDAMQSSLRLGFPWSWSQIAAWAMCTLAIVMWEKIEKH